MEAISKDAQTVMEKLIELLNELDLGDGSAIIDNSQGAFMEVHIAREPDNPAIIRHFRTQDGKGGTVYSLAHYYEQNGDLMADPFMEFLEGANGRFYPISFRQDSTGYDRPSLVFDEEDKFQGYYEARQADQAEFADMWLENIRLQQGL